MASKRQQQKQEATTTYLPAIVVLILSVAAGVPICWGLGHVHRTHVEFDEQLLFVIACLLCVGVWLLSYVVLRLVLSGRASASDPFLALFSFFSFTCVVDLVLAFNIDGQLDWLAFYLEHGERYLQSAYGAAINYWDGLVHLPLYLLLVHRIANGPVAGYLAAGAFWFGSVMNSLVVFLPGNAAGSFALQLKLSFLLNVPYVIVPVSFLVRLLAADAQQPRRQVVDWTLCRLLMVPATAVALVVYAIRFLAVVGSPLEFVRVWVAEVEPILDDPLKYPALQAIVDFMYRVPVSLLLLLALFRTTVPSWVLTLAWINFGAAAQGAFSYAWSAASFDDMADTEFAQAVGQLGFHLLQLTLVSTSAFFVFIFHYSQAEPAKPHKE